ncbi:hypothetical protein AKJ55_01340 [candidate division MSBL1 archaeon SCGC-AAA382M17]|uniref:Right handed beta helix domain-containing protein n=1 Tax=candidate division MSBL1 archaeon SCGC-AAA382M17 TaxID=1698284 RepID=A0ABR5TLY0_9EURY|nr:hypothetical protein AKJ55_01340 [candidate division MSBL1 archaeon SCGC-AAA382M17]
MKPKFQKVTYVAILFGAMLIASGCTKQEKIINAANYGLKQGADAVPALRKALEVCVEENATKLIIPKGKYDCYPDMATEKYVRVSNNDNGMKRIVFPLEGLKNFEIDGQGARFIMYSQILPFNIEGCENITIRNLSIDWNKPFYFQGTVIATHESTNSFDLKVFEECDYEIVANELIFLEKPGKAIRTWKQWAMPVKKDFGWEQNIDWNIWYDSKIKAPAYKGNECLLRSFNEKLNIRYHAKEIEPGVVRFFNAAPKLPQKGWVLIIKGKKDLQRVSPAIHIFDDKNVHIENVDVHHAGGMGLIAERTENISLVDFNVVLPSGSDRMVSTTADATHFVNCKGMIGIDSCMFENMLDDASNFHGIYTYIIKLVDDYTIGVNRMHGQQTGFQFAEAGDSVRLSETKDMKSYAVLKVASVRSFNEEYMEITLDEKVSDILRPSSVAENVSWQPDVQVKNCTVRRNRARSLLISTQGEVLIENNTFKTCSGQSLQFAGDATFWYESSPVRDVIIRNNHFKDFGLGGGNSPVIAFIPELKFDGKPTHYYHQNVIFNNNTCEVFGRRLVIARSVKNFVFKGNTILPSKTYPLAPLNQDAFSFRDCKDVTIEDNHYQWPEKTSVTVDNFSKDIKVEENIGIVK